MIVGSANIETLAEDAATIESFGTSEIVFEDVVCFQMTMEMRNQARSRVAKGAASDSTRNIINASMGDRS